MRKIILLIAIGCLGGYVWASTVSTIDGKSFTVTNDAGTTWPMTNQDIMQKVNQFNGMVRRDEITLGSDQESLVLWQGVEQMAINAVAQLNQTNGT